MAPGVALLRIVEELGRFHEDVANVVAEHDQRPYPRQADKIIYNLKRNKSDMPYIS